jgi:hypothetical protein
MEKSNVLESLHEALRKHDEAAETLEAGIRDVEVAGQDASSLRDLLAVARRGLTSLIGILDPNWKDQKKSGSN